MSLLTETKIQAEWVRPDRMRIRRMRDTDIESIMAIESISFGRHHWSEDSFANEMKGHLGRYYSLLLEPPAENKAQSEILIGYCGFWLIMDEAHITTIAVRPDCRGFSLGELQLCHILERAFSHSVKWVTLEVRASNYTAQNLYYKYGFDSAGLRRKYYQDNDEDALIMTTPDILSETYRKQYKDLKQAFFEKKGGFPEGFSIS
ncbi:MAG: ribosomal protein S18-alanine N-acetyltransferase [Cyanobacteria bacterium]|nr:ribosomal protein S18-alanine N-acetyltransferase [Cyanobacteriota bacterium]